MKKRKNRKKMQTKGSGSIFFAQNDKPLSAEIATRSNSQDFQSILNILPNPDTVLQKKGQDIGIYRELRADAKVQATLGSRKAGVKKFKSTIFDNNADPRLVAAIENLFLEKWEDWALFDEILEAAQFGYKPFELIWEYSDGLILPVGSPVASDGSPIKSESPGLVGKPPEWFRYSPDNKLLFLSRENYLGEEVPEDKFVVARRNSSYDNPYGEAILSAVFWPVIFKKNSIKFWNLFVEKYGSPLLVGEYKPGAQQKDVDSLIDSMEHMVQDGVAAISQNTKLSLLDGKSSSSGNQEFSAIAEYMDKQISQAILGQNLTSDVSAGSLAAAEVHSDVKDELIAEDAKIVERFFNRVFVLIRKANFPDSRTPKLRLTSPEMISKELSERDKNLNEIGVSFTKPYFQKKYNLEDEDFEITKKEEPAKETKQNQSNFAEEEQEEFNDQNAVDHFINSFTASDYQEFAEELLAPIIKIVKDSSNHTEAMEQLSRTYPKMSSDKLETSLAKAIYVTESMGNMSNE